MYHHCFGGLFIQGSNSSGGLEFIDLLAHRPGEQGRALPATGKVSSSGIMLGLDLG
jgi:hypothetical protein